MLSYNKLKDKPRDFLAATGLTLQEFLKLLPAFKAAYEKLYRSELTREGNRRQRRAGGGAKGVLPSFEDKLLFILVYQKTNPLQTMHGLQFDLSQPQANYWIHHLLPVLPQALVDLGLQPERDASRVAASHLALEGAPDLAIDGTERRRQRPQDAQLQKEHYSGKKKAPTDKNLLPVNETTGKVVYLGPTLAGQTHDKKAADEARIAYPVNATLDKDTGFQGYEPEGVLTKQPKKNQRPATECWRPDAQSDFLRCARGGRTRDLGRQTVSDCQRCLAVDQTGHFGSGDGDCLRLAQPPCRLPSPTADFRFAQLAEFCLKPIMSTIKVPFFIVPFLLLI
jgi:hypothetical protein